MTVKELGRIPVFSAHAEVVPLGEGGNNANGGILRARGGSSFFWLAMWKQARYSPRTRR